ncbi:hypothetical protein [Algoriphagus sp.]|uniref:hypothetical protein n=1 Tax=Algoriphagus sp. TaxID=1872435 RepID=UPI0025DB4F08|nr:hypothetical protein [Algoriphagus sp.]
MKLWFCLSFILIGISSVAQTSYRNELGGRITKTQFEEQILNGPYFGVPSDKEGEMVLIFRMPFGKVDEPLVFYEKTGNSSAFSEGKSLIVIFYPGPDECNSNSRDFDIDAMEKADKSLKKWAEKGNAASPIYLYKNPVGLEKYSSIMNWEVDPEGVFEKEFFKYPYPCKSFVVLHPSGEYRAILGDFPLSQIDQALKKLNRANK